MESPPDDLTEQKRSLRKAAAGRRARLHADLAPGAADALARNVVALAGGLMPGVVSGYLAMGDEMDVMPALLALSDNGWRAALPVVAAKAQPLTFRRWAPGEALEDGVFGTRHPAAAADEVRPALLLVPFLAFDRAGYRLGWGGGFYDRTLAQLRADGRPVVAAGVGYAGQEVDAVPRASYDAALDWVVTEDDIIKIVP